MNQLTQYWSIGVSLITIVLWFGRLEWMIKNHDSRVHAIELEQDQVAKDLAEMKTDIKWIREALSGFRR